LDAYSDTVFQASIRKISPSKDLRTQTFLIEAIFEHPPDRLYAGLSGEANIIVAERENVLSIPLSYLVEGNKVLGDDGLIEVETGLRNLERVEIRSGLNETTRIRRPE